MVEAWRVLPICLCAVAVAGAEPAAAAAAARAEGRPERAVPALRAALAASPGNAELEAVLGLHLALGGDPAGIALIRSAMAREPGNADHPLRLAQAQAAIASRSPPGPADAAPDPERPRWRLDLAVSGDRFSERRDDEHALLAGLSRDLGGGFAGAAVVEHQHRFGYGDHRFEAGLYAPAGPGYGWLRVGAAPGNRFLPDADAEAGADIPVAGALALLGRATVRWYPDETIGILRPGVRLGREDGPALEAAWSWAVSDAQPTVDSWELRGETPIGPRWRAGLAWSRGEENAPPLPVGRVDAAAATLRWEPDPALMLRLDALWEHRPDLYDRIGAGLAATIRF